MKEIFRTLLFFLILLVALMVYDPSSSSRHEVKKLVKTSCKQAHELVITMGEGWNEAKRDTLSEIPQEH